MAEQISSPLSNEELQQIKYETFIREVQRIIDSNESPAPAKPGWQKFLESTGGTAFVTVVLGGIMGAFVTGIFQYAAKERERNILEYQQTIQKQQEAIKSIYELVGTSFSSADNLVRFKNSPGNNAAKETDEAKKKQINDQKKIIVEKYEEAQKNWASNRMQPFLLLILYYSNNREIIESWKKVDISLTQYLEFSEDCFNFNDCTKCEEAKNQLDGHIEDFLVKTSNNSKGSS